ncbi:pentapeptide repeat-containing protein [Dethiobacter alkaliphilus]|uniref:pentapeptide repeat-containing protein n=1 Tax=Dethiobacter alkaliphilus TaxID=427926 RepID=UPI002226BA94|nr:pentapeptide repeat-containing protein [Dethiobacter alkaliphilus]MCW3491574.1 pentapeptide repeat-containing protein [Dethiobacter alkaliphilus]
MIKREIKDQYIDLASELKIDCDRCSGLCCVALCFLQTAGFPEDKAGGKPCMNLMPNYRCKIYSQLAQKGMKGCLAYDCFGAGQKVTQVCCPHSDWRTDPKQSATIFAVFSIVFQLHQMLWYLIEALSVNTDETVASEIERLIQENQQMTEQESDKILSLDVEKYKTKVNKVLKKVCRVIAVNPVESQDDKDFLGKDFNKCNLDGSDFSMSLMIAANFEGCSIRGANFLGTDMRDANIKNADLRESMFLTQMQINSTRGNSNTKLPANLSRPSIWEE